ncbi:MAG: hypothetical protein ACPHX2_02105 [Candidatus Poseidoniaceae archaeon]
MGRPWTGQPLALALLAMLLLASAPNALALRTDGLEEATTVTVQARNTVLVEEMTATWCATCADIDPYLAEVADRHGSRLALVGLHPMDGLDGVATEASEARLERWRAVHNNLNQTPAFLVEGETPLVGPEIWPEVTRRMLELESSRPARANMSLSATRHADGILLDIGAAQPLEGRQVTLMLLQHGRSSASYGVEAEPGSTYDRVLVELYTMTTNGSWNSVCDGACSLIFTTANTATLANAEGEPFSLILVDETADANLSASNTHSAGVLELAVRPSSVASGADHRWWLATGMLACGVAIAAWPRPSSDSGRKISEEE